ncbi:hypothetical protein CSX04_07942 [Burkholderia cepacia]|nr:hypothetical protein CSX04_07942 [Burkholderia cepacia]
MPNLSHPVPATSTDRRAGSAFANRQAAVAAVELLLPSLSAALQSDFVGDSGCLHIVIMDPALGPLDATFEDAILYEFSLPDAKDWDATTVPTRARRRGCRGRRAATAMSCRRWSHTGCARATRICGAVSRSAESWSACRARSRGSTRRSRDASRTACARSRSTVRRRRPTRSRSEPGPPGPFLQQLIKKSAIAGPRTMRRGRARPGTVLAVPRASMLVATSVPSTAWRLNVDRRCT